VPAGSPARHLPTSATAEASRGRAVRLARRGARSVVCLCCVRSIRPRFSSGSLRRRATLRPHIRRSAAPRSPSAVVPACHASARRRPQRNSAAALVGLPCPPRLFLHHHPHS
jgi:hypothetical protein